MNQKFFELGEDKRLAIINAGLEIFGKNDYKHALTDDIAAKAGISKGLLFYYFHNKLELYQYLAEYSVQLILEIFEQIVIIDGKDFFEAIKLGVKTKMNLVNDHPYIYGFVLRYYQSRKEISNGSYDELYDRILRDYDLVGRCDTSKFKENVDPNEVWNIIYWMSEGFMDAYKCFENLDVKAIQEDYFRYLDILKNSFYREECL